MNPMQLWRAFVARIEAFTARERAGLAAVAAVVALVLATGAFDWALRSGEAAQNARGHRVAADAAFARESDARFQEQVGLATAHVWRWSIVEQSESLAQARILSEADELVQQAGIDARATLATAEPVEGPQLAVRPVYVTIRGPFEWRSFMGLLNAMRESEHGYAPDAVEVSSSQNGQPEFTMLVRAPFLPDASR